MGRGGVATGPADGVVTAGFEGPALALPGGCVLLDQAGALLVLRSLQMVGRQAAASSARLPPEFAPVLTAVQGAACSGAGTSEVPAGLDLRPSELREPMTAREVAVELGCSARNVLGLRARGVLPADSRAGRLWLFDRVTVAAFLLRRDDERVSD